MEKPQLSSHQEVQRISRSMNSKWLCTLDSITQWDQDDISWKEWKTPDFRQDLKHQWDSLISLLKGASPIKQ